MESMTSHKDMMSYMMKNSDAKLKEGKVM